MRKSFTWFNLTSLTLGFVFLYLPIVLLVIFSFNGGRLVTVWAGFSTHWYGELWRDQQILDAAWLTIKLGLASATLATVLGTMAALALVRYGRFWGRTLFTGMVYAPIVMPEIITGLALLLFFVALNLERGFFTLFISHVTFTMCYVTLTVQSRIVSFDRSLEEAAMDLGCSPFETFFRITLPLIWPAVAAGWLLAFTLSIDDVVISNFTSGPGSSTLPIRIFSAVRLGVSPEINALCTVLIGFVAVGAIAFSISQKLSMERRARDERLAERGGQMLPTLGVAKG